MCVDVYLNMFDMLNIHLDDISCEFDGHNLIINEDIERYRICIDSGLMTNDYDYDDCYHLHTSKDE